MAQLVHQEYAIVPIGELRPHPANPRKGNVSAIADSVAANGFYGAIVAQRSTGMILAGNHRWEAARREGLTEVPVCWLDCTDAEARRILTVDNRTNDEAGYDNEALARLLNDIRAEAGSLVGTGYTQEALDTLLQDAADAVLASGSGNEGAGVGYPPESDAPFAESRAAELVEKWQTAEGQLWRIPSLTTPGREHRLMCGDSTKADQVRRLLDGEQPRLMATDPALWSEVRQLLAGRILVR